MKKYLIWFVLLNFMFFVSQAQDDYIGRYYSRSIRAQERAAYK